METEQIMRKPVDEKCLKEKYASCIRINGVPILPPLITPEKCAAIKYYRKQAMKVEKQILERKKALFIEQQQNYIAPVQKVHTVENTDFTETILDCCRNIETYLSTTFDIDSTQVEAQKQAPILTFDIQASQYLNNELVLFNSKREDCQNVDIDKYQRCDENFSLNSRVPQDNLSLTKKVGNDNFCLNKKVGYNILNKQIVHESSSLTKNVDEVKPASYNHYNDDSLSLSKSLSRSRLDGDFQKPWLDEVNKLHTANSSFSESFKRTLVDLSESTKQYDLQSLNDRKIHEVVNRGVNRVLSKGIEEVKVDSFDKNNLDVKINVNNYELPNLNEQNDEIKNQQVNQSQVYKVRSNEGKIGEVKNQHLTQSQIVKQVNQSYIDKVREQANQNQIDKANLSKFPGVENQTGNNENYNRTMQSDINENRQTDKSRIDEIKSFEKPQLIRSNSYILETPSPVLLEHLKKNKDANAIQRCWSSSDNIFTDKKFSNLNTTKCEDSFPKNPDLNSTRGEGSVLNFDTSCTDTELKNMSDNESNSCISDSENKLREFIDNNVPKNTEDENETVIINNESDKCDSLKEILKKIPEEYSKKILEYLEKHKEHEKENNCEDFGAPQSFSTPNAEVLHNTHNQTIYYSVGDDSKIGDYLNAASKELDLSKELSFREYSSMVVYETNERVFSNNKSNKKEMKERSVDDDYERYQRAASKIGAVVKGYLTRRLLNTEKVQNLINVIKEALVCAVQLHSENVDNIDEYDVELHRRLIQQVSAACYAFHDVFFNIPTSEQMSIIALDRQKKRRPPSIVSTRSTPRKSTKALLSSRSMSAF